MAEIKLNHIFKKYENAEDYSVKGARYVTRTVNDVFETVEA